MSVRAVGHVTFFHLFFFSYNVLWLRCATGAPTSAHVASDFIAATLVSSRSASVRKKRGEREKESDSIGAPDESFG